MGQDGNTSRLGLADSIACLARGLEWLIVDAIIARSGRSAKYTIGKTRTGEKARLTEEYIRIGLLISAISL